MPPAMGGMENGLKKPLLAPSGSSDEEDRYLDKALKGKPVSGFESAGIFSKAFFLWVTPLLELGYKKPLTKDDVPLLSRQHRARTIYSSFIANWPKRREPNSTRRTLFKTFGRQFVCTCSVAAFVRLCVLYVGPLLIQSFVQVTSGGESFAYEGYVLVLVLLVAKSTEVTASHLYQFNCQKIGVQVRSALISAVYRKGLRLSSYARQSHGAGQIVNYMSVDVQQISDCILQLNNLWLVPGQVIVALGILFFASGVAAIAGVFVMCFMGLVTFLTSRLLRGFQKKLTVGRDKRMVATVEALSNMKIVKLQAWDAKFLERVTGARREEYRSLAKYMYTNACNTTLMYTTPLLAVVAIFVTSYLMGRTLTATMAFTTIATVKIVQEPLRLFPQSLINISQALISLQRLENYLWSDELVLNTVERLPLGASDLAVDAEGCTFKWGAELEAPSLIDINLKIKPGSLVAIVGRVGMGKSSLLAALLGEMEKVSGKVTTCGSAAYVSQQAWIQSGTIQDNILFGQPMNRARYQSAINNCALRTDLAQMDHGDLTEIGERGLNMSGGQKQRIQLARALYQNCDTYFLDDVFSAVDAHTASDLFRDCILGGLAGKTVLLVTHQTDFLPRADLIVVMKNGRIVQAGRYDELLTGGTAFETLVEASNEAFDKVTAHEQKDNREEGSSARKTLQSDSFVVRSSPAAKSPTKQSDETWPTFSSSPSQAAQAPEQVNQKTLERSLSQKVWSVPKEKADKKSPQLTEEEHRETGKVGWSVYWAYGTRVYKGALLLLLIVVQIAWQAFQIGGDTWVAYGSTPAKEGDEQSQKSSRFIVIYCLLALGSALSTVVRSFLATFSGLLTSQSFYLGMLKSLFRSPMAFFDTTPTGRILSRASTDQAATDVMVSVWVLGAMGMGFQLMGVIIVTYTITWQAIIFLVVLGYAYLKYQNFYLTTARELTRVDALTKAPVIHHFQETITGFVTVRSFQQQDRFVQTNVDRIDSNLRMDFHNQASTEWVGIRMEMIGVILLCTSTIFLVALSPTLINPDLVGLCLTYGMNLNGTLFVYCWIYCQLENKMVSVERINQYTRLPEEAELSIEKTRPASNWPTSGHVVLQNLKLRYRPQTPLVLKGVTLTIRGGQKVGVVGRTGSGKSTLILALFRLVEAAEGSVVIDGVDISTLGLNDLRSRLSIIPQEPTLFDGTVRSNLDPLNEHGDADIWQALEKCQLAHVVKLLDGKLDSPVLEGGENWSLGQRQLFCLGRVLLKRSRILVLDEATASVDAETDVAMQAIVRREFADSTVISVAHRIPTVMDSDKVLVLDDGRVKEYGAPNALLEYPNSLFSSLVQEYSHRSDGPAEAQQS